MKLLFDQNISFRILKKIEYIFPESNQVRALGLENKSDINIWKYAKKHDFSIVTFDADFADISYLKGHPPKIIWLRTGNLTTNNIFELLKKHQEIIKKFIQSKDFDDIPCLQID